MTALDEDRHLIPLPASYFELENVHQKLATKEEICASIKDGNNNPYGNGDGLTVWSEICATEGTGNSNTNNEMAITPNVTTPSFMQAPFSSANIKSLIVLIVTLMGIITTTIVTTRKYFMHVNNPTDKNLTGSIQVSNEVLGHGSHGTVVYRGQLAGRPVAVKRLLNDYHKTAERYFVLCI
jgi:hypothetical protein